MGHFISRLELPNSDTVLFYLRYFSARHLLAVISGKGAASFDGLGIDLNLDPEFRIEQLANPNSMNLIHEFVQDTFGKSFFEARTIRLHDEPIGVLVLASGASDCKNHFRDTWVGALETISSIQHMRLRLQTLDNHCPVTEALSFNGFASAAGKEVARSRRLERPTSVIVIRVDGWFELSQDMNEVQKKNWLRALHRFLVKHSRVNDDVGHLFEGVFGVLLPHTGVEGAKAKAGHLRGLIENAELKVGGQIKRFTMSCGVSEYPRRSQDAESLVQSALQAVNQEDLMSNQSYLAPLMAQGSVDFDV